MLQGFFQIAITLLILVAITRFLGRYMARVFLGQKTLLDPVMNPVKRIIYALAGVRAKDEMTSWQTGLIRVQITRMAGARGLQPSQL